MSECYLKHGYSHRELNREKQNVVSVQDMKEELGININDCSRDKRILRIVTAAQSALEHIAGKTFTIRTYEQLMDCFPCYTGPVALGRYPAKEIVSIEYYGCDLCYHPCKCTTTTAAKNPCYPTAVGGVVPTECILPEGYDAAAVAAAEALALENCLKQPRRCYTEKCVKTLRKCSYHIRDEIQSSQVVLSDCCDCWPCVECARPGVKIIYKAGHGEAWENPPNVELAIIIAAKQMYDYDGACADVPMSSINLIADCCTGRYE